MTLLFVSWLLFAPLFLLLRRALLTADAPPVEAGLRPLRSPDEVAAGLDVSLRALDVACSHAELAHTTGHASSTLLMLSCVRQSAAAFVRDMSLDVAVWGAATSEARGAADVDPPPVTRLRSPWLRALAWSHRVGRVALPGTVARLRLHLFVLRAMLRVVWWTTWTLRVPRWRRPWRELEALRSDLPVVVEQVRRGHVLVLDSARVRFDSSSPAV